MYIGYNDWYMPGKYHVYTWYIPMYIGIYTIHIVTHHFKMFIVCDVICVQPEDPKGRIVPQSCTSFYIINVTSHRKTNPHDEGDMGIS